MESSQLPCEVLERRGFDQLVALLVSREVPDGIISHSLQAKPTEKRRYREFHDPISLAVVAIDAARDEVLVLVVTATCNRQRVIHLKHSSVLGTTPAVNAPVPTLL